MTGINIDNIMNQLKDMMDKERFRHSVQVSKVAEEIADYYHLSPKKGKIVGLIHDCAKDYSNIQLKYFIDKYHIQLSEIEENIPSIWHAYVGAALARDLFKLKDEEMLDAIKYHSTASGNLTLLGKIIYIADKIEPERKLEYIDKVRKVVWRDIDQAMLILLDYELQHLIEKKVIIHPATLMARNQILYNEIQG